MHDSDERPLGLGVWQQYDWHPIERRMWNDFLRKIRFNYEYVLGLIDLV